MTAPTSPARSSTTAEFSKRDHAAPEESPVPFGAQLDLTPQGLLVYQLMNEVSLNQRVAVRWWHQTRELEDHLRDTYRRLVDVLEVVRILHPKHSGECSACALIEDSG